jgi:hypothetical protein
MGYPQDNVRIFVFITCHFNINPTSDFLDRLPYIFVRQQYEARRTGGQYEGNFENYLPDFYR